MAVQLTQTDWTEARLLFLYQFTCKIFPNATLSKKVVETHILKVIRKFRLYAKNVIIIIFFNNS